MYFWINQKKIQKKHKAFYVFYLMNNNKVVHKLGYTLYVDNYLLVRLNIELFYFYLMYYKGLLNMRKTIFNKFFILCYMFNKKFIK